MKIVDVLLSEGYWKIHVKDEEKTEQPKFTLPFTTKKSFRVAPAKYEDADYDKTIAKVEKIADGYMLWIDQTMVMLPCESGVWHLQVEKSGKIEVVQADAGVIADKLLCSEKILFKSASNSYMYPMIGANQEFYFEQTNKEIGGSNVLSVRLGHYFTEGSILYLDLEFKEKEELPKEMKLFLRNYEEVSGFSMSVEAETDTEVREIENKGTKETVFIWRLKCDLSGESENLLLLQNTSCRMGIEYWKDGKYNYRIIRGRKSRGREKNGYGIVDIPKDKLALIPYFSGKAAFRINIVSWDARDYYGYLLDAHEIKTLNFKEIQQEGNSLVVQFASEQLEAFADAKLTSVDRKNKELFQIDLDENLLKQGKVVVPFEKFMQYRKGQAESQRYVVYLSVRQGEKECVFRFMDSTHLMLEKELYDNTKRYYNPFSMGEEELTTGEKNGVSLLPYLEQRVGYLRFLVLPKEKAYLEQQKVVLRNIKISHGKLKLYMTLKDHGIYPESVSIKLRSGVVDKCYSMKISMHHLPGNTIFVFASIDLKTIEFEQFYWDIAGTWNVDGESYQMQICNRRKLLSRSLYLRHMVYKGENGFIAYPYRKKSKEFALYYRQKTPYDSRVFVWKEYLALLCAKVLKKYWYRKNIWLVYEKYCQMAQDNGYYFFKYCMEKLPEGEKNHIYYVIDTKAADYEVVKQYGKHVIPFLSFKHMVYLQAARVLISSDTKAHAYAWHSANSIYRNSLYKKKNVFLQHGVMAFKCCHKGLRKGSANPSNLFITSSQVEASIIEKYFEYSQSEIAVTGLARWDVLEDKANPAHKEILLMPTWRTWLEEVQKEEFMQSDYYKHYMDFLNQPQLVELLEKYDVTMNFYIHPKFREYLDAFSVGSKRIQLIPFGSQPLNELLMSCSMMITDYSSACWDVYYQGKPVLFYLFDLELYNEVQGSYIDMEKEAFGDNARDGKTLLDLMEYYIKNDFREKECYAKQREILLPYRDDLNSKRTYDIIKKKGW